VFICAKKRPLKPIRALREKMEKECPFILPKKAIKFEKEIEKFLVVKASENLMAAGRRGVGTSLLLARRSMGESRFLVSFQSPRLLKWGPLKRIEGFFTLTLDPRRWRTLRICLRHGSG
jgi:hypothetical protein